MQHGATSVIDMNRRADLAESARLDALHAEGATICMVTHDPRYAHVADRSIHLFDGQVVSEDDVRKAQELEQAGFDLHLTKPVEPKELFEAIVPGSGTAPRPYG